MRKIVSLLFCLLFIAAFFSGCFNENSNGKLKVYTSIYPMYYFASIIGGEKADVVNLLKTGEDAHSFELSPKNRLALEKADVFIYSGAGMEHWVDSFLASKESQNLKIVEAASTVTLIKSSDHEEEEPHDEHEHEHGEYDPHIWLSPKNAKLIIDSIQKTFSEKDPENAEYYENNYQTYAAMLDQLDQEFKIGLENAKNRTIVVSHRAFGYLCDEYNLTQISLQGISAENETSFKKLAEVVEIVKQNNIKILFWEETSGNASIVQQVADTVNEDQTVYPKVALKVLSPIETLTQKQIENKDDYFSIMRLNLEALKLALL